MAAAVVLGTATLSGCAAGMISQTADQVPNRDGSDAVSGLVGVHDALLGDTSNGPRPVAFAAGSELPINFWISNDADEDETLLSVTTSAGEVSLDPSAGITIPGHGLQQVGGDSDTTATITSTSADVKYGFPLEVTFTFANAEPLTMKVALANPSERGADRQGTNIYPAPETNIWDDSSFSTN